MILANQTIAQLLTGLPTPPGNAQTIITFRISRADAEVLARVLGEIDLEAIKRENQTEIQHPIFAPLFEQWEEFIQHLTKQAVRQATVKTADDRIAVIWPEKVKDGNCSDEKLEDIITSCLKQHGRSFEHISQRLVKQPPINQEDGLFAN